MLNIFIPLEVNPLPVCPHPPAVNTALQLEMSALWDPPKKLHDPLRKTLNCNTALTAMVENK